MIALGARHVGPGAPAYIAAEIGQNHNGSIETALEMIAKAKECHADAVKFQTRTVDLCVPEAMKGVMREVPWSKTPVSYLDYRRHLELGREEYRAIHEFCRAIDMPWFTSVWDVPSIERMAEFDLPALKIPSACLTDDELLSAARATGKPVILSTGGSTLAQIDHAVWSVLGEGPLVLMACTSSYPAADAELNLLTIKTFAARYPGVVIGWSGHEKGVVTSVCAAALGAAVIERHFTDDRSRFGSDQAASLEPPGFALLVRDIRKWEEARGDGVKCVYDSERPVMARLRRVP